MPLPAPIPVLILLQPVRVETGRVRTAIRQTPEDTRPFHDDGELVVRLCDRPHSLKAKPERKCRDAHIPLSINSRGHYDLFLLVVLVRKMGFPSSYFSVCCGVLLYILFTANRLLCSSNVPQRTFLKRPRTKN